MFNHKDTLGAPAWQVQLTGQKTWHICSPDQDEFMYEAGEVDTFSPNYKKYPLFLQVITYIWRYGDMEEEMDAFVITFWCISMFM